MLRFLLRRLAWTVVVIWAVASIALVLGRVSGSDAVAQEFGLGGSRVLSAMERHARGLDRPFAAQYGEWIARGARLDLGTSARYDRPVGDLVWSRTANTLVLAGAALALALLLGLSAGIVTGSRPHARASAVIRAISLVLVSCPPLVAALLLVWAAAASGLLPVGGMFSIDTAAGWPGAFGDLLRHLPVPALALALPFAASVERIQADALSRALEDPAIPAARARGVGGAALLWRHAWRLGAAPVIGVLGLMAGALLSGSLAVEVVTAWPGLGRLTVDALQARDIYLSAGCAIAAACLLCAGVLASDLALGAIDPRVREADGVREALA